MGRCAGEDGDLTFDSESVKVTRSEEKTDAALFKKSRTSKNGYQTTGVIGLLTVAKQKRFKESKRTAVEETEVAGGSDFGDA
ncbi:hypothetical protein AXG93_2956s1010 [Marchantia polymorpha subsp. ruderalis]|uniref:Uncharacterized protein n=1 Tax=Marchantia polymorpha subsp. ruderalis TaxID=1480154 RepID=A0A176WC88_MARPO|nr:hypothetical protein AXG93_2956s1010 [Marchantia polymorpha subsp. ruderalis]